MTIVPDNILKLMNPKDRPKGNAGKTREESEQAYSFRLEKEDHKIFSQWLDMKGIPYIHAQNHKKSTIKIGWPDYTILYQGRAICIEMKAKGGKCSEEQLKTLGNLDATGTLCRVCYSATEAIEMIRFWIKSFDTEE